MNKVLVLTLMMLSFVSKVGGSHRKIKQCKVCFTCKLKKRLWRKKNQHKITKPIKKETEKSFLDRNKEAILSTFVFIAIIVLIIFLIKKAQQLTPEQQISNKIKKELKDKSYSKIFQYLGLHIGYFMEMQPESLKTFNDTITKEEVENTELYDAIFKVIEKRKDTKGYKYFIDNEYNNNRLKDGVCYSIDKFIDRNMIDITLKEVGKVIFSNPSSTNKPISLEVLDNNGKQITNIEFKKIQSLINAQIKLKEVFLKKIIGQQKKETEFTFEDIAFFSFLGPYLDCILQKKPLEVDEQIQKIQRILKENNNVQEVLKARNEINKNNKLITSNLDLGFHLDCFKLYHQNCAYESCGDYNHENCKIFSKQPNSLCTILTSKVHGEKEIQEIQNTLKKTCEIIIKLNKKISSKEWKQTIRETTLANSQKHLQTTSKNISLRVKEKATHHNLHHKLHFIPYSSQPGQTNHPRTHANFHNLHRTPRELHWTHNLHRTLQKHIHHNPHNR